MEVVVEQYNGVRRRLALALGWDASKLNKYFNEGKSTLPSGGSLLHISQVTGYSIDWLLTGDGPRRRGGAPTGDNLAAQLRAYLIEDSHLSGRMIEGVEVAEAAPPGGALTRVAPTQPIANLLPASDEELLFQTAGIWHDALSRLADILVRVRALEDVSATRATAPTDEMRRSFLDAYAAAQAAARAQSSADMRVRFEWETLSKPGDRGLFRLEEWQQG